MRSMFGTKLLEKLKQIQQLRQRDIPIVGCNPNEIRRIKESQEIDYLPDLFEMFLTEMGKKCGDIFMNGFFRPFDAMANSLFSRDNAKRRLNEAMRRNVKRELKPNAVVFIEIVSDNEDCWGSSWWYFYASEDVTDPTVYKFWDVDRCSDQDFIDDMIELYGTFDDAVHHEVASLSEFLTRFIAKYESVEAQKDFLEKYT